MVHSVPMVSMVPMVPMVPMGQRTPNNNMQYGLNIYKTNDKTKLAVKKELTEKNPVETHEGGLGQDDPENKQKVEEAYGAAAKILD